MYERYGTTREDRARMAEETAKARLVKLPNAANNVGKLRRERWMTQKELAVKAGVALRTIHTIESERGVPRRHIAKKVIEALGFSFENRHLVFPNL